jgi:hypothetical protein
MPMTVSCRVVRPVPTITVPSFNLQDDGVHVGTVMRVPFYAPSQRAALDSGHMNPRGPTLALHVVGIEAAVSEFPGTDGEPEKDLYATAALGGRSPVRQLASRSTTCG